MGLQIRGKFTHFILLLIVESSGRCCACSDEAVASAMNRQYFYLLCCLVMGWHTQALQAQTIPAPRLVDWTQAGIQLDTFPQWPVVNASSLGLVGDGVTPNDSLLEVFLAAQTGQGVVLQFPAGHYRFEQTIDLPNAVVLRGSGADRTTFRFDLGGNGHSIAVQGRRGRDSTHLSQPALKGNAYIRLWNPNVVQAGDWIQLQQYDLDWVTSSWGAYRTGQVVQIERLSGDTAWLHQALRLDYDTARTAALWTLQLQEKVGIECFKIHRLDDTAPQQSSNILFKYVANCWVSGIESENCTFAHVETEFSAHVTIAHSYFHHGFTYGGNGRAYGVVFHLTASACRAENNIFEHLRHSVLLQAGANGNVIAYNYSHDPYWDNVPNDGAGDLVLHGNYPYANLFEQNICQNIIIDNSHGPNGPHNTFFRNRAELYGIFFSATNSPNQNLVANEVTNNTFPYRLANYRIQGSGHFLYGNNDKGTIKPTGTQQVPDTSYAYARRPDFVSNSQWGGLGTPQALGVGSIPAYDRWQAQTLFPGTCGLPFLTPVAQLETTPPPQVFPNPAQSVVRFNHTAVVERMALYHMAGQLVAVWQPQSKQAEWTLPPLAQGLYWLELEVAGAAVPYRQPLILQP